MYIKICGLRTEAAVETAVAAGADAIGFVLCASPRQVSVESARALRDRIPASAHVVAVVRHIDDRAIDDALALGADLLQGEGDPQRPMPDGLRRLVACNIDSIPEGQHWLLLDGPRPGSGRPTDFDVARRVAAERPMILAGGLAPDNVGDAIRYVRPAGVDVSSGVERRRGEKDPDLIRAFIHQVRQVETNHDYDHGRP